MKKTFKVEGTIQEVIDFLKDNMKDGDKVTVKREGFTLIATNDSESQEEVKKYSWSSVVKKGSYESEYSSCDDDFSRKEDAMDAMEDAALALLDALNERAQMLFNCDDDFFEIVEGEDEFTIREIGGNEEIVYTITEK